MEKKAVSGIMLKMLLISTVVLAFSIRSVRAEETIYIRPNGAIYPSTAPISRAGDVYTLIDNIYDSIVVQRSNIIIDGDGYTVQGTGSGRGIRLSQVSNVTVRNTRITAFGDGVFLYHSSNNNIVENNITVNDSGILISSSNYNNVIGNDIANNNNGISLFYSSDNTLYHNNFLDNMNQVSSHNSVNVWDDGYPSGGNYWSDYAGMDANHDGIGDTPYVIDVSNQDRYPSMNPWTPVSRDRTSPNTLLNAGEPNQVVEDTIYLTSTTPILLLPQDNPGGSGVALLVYRIYNATYNIDWITYTQPLYLTELNDGTYYIDYNSTDNAGNVESTNTQTIILDITPPIITETNFEGLALQDGVTLEVSAWDLSQVASITFSIQYPQGNTIPPFESMPATPTSEGKWELDFDTVLLPDGFYFAAVTGTDVLGNIGTTTTPFSIRNWACIELLPASETNKAGRTMPVKFSLRIVEAVDPAQPFVRNEELTILIYEKRQPEKILQTSTYGTTASDYRIDTLNEHYITNFKTQKKPTTYVVEIYRKDMFIGTFEFCTIK